MKILRPHIMLLLVVAGTVPRPQVAQATEEALYQVEVLVFRHTDSSRTTPEAERVVLQKFDSELERQLALISTSDAQLESLDASLDVEQAERAPNWTPVVGTTRILSADADKIRRLSAYELLAHLAWTQPARDIDDARTISLAELGLDPQLAYGSINFYSKRYLHLGVDVTLGEEPAPPTQSADPFSFPAEAMLAKQPSINDSRRIRLQQLIYFDEPQFGIVAVAQRIEPEGS